MANYEMPKEVPLPKTYDGMGGKNPGLNYPQVAPKGVPVTPKTGVARGSGAAGKQTFSKNG